jgi:hypothetical protein
MKRFPLFLFLGWTISSAQAAPPSLTIYNGGFAVVRESIPLDLHAGENSVRSTEVTSQIDPGSVILHDPTGKTEFRILEQKFSSEPATRENMLAMFEGQTIPFHILDLPASHDVNGKIIRGAFTRQISGGTEKFDPIVELDGRYVVGLPGLPMFPKLPDSVVLKPELSWKISVVKAAKFEAELVFLTDGLGWEADYDAITAENGSITRLVGWITIKNSVGAHFDDAKVKVVAGDVPRVSPGTTSYYSGATAERTIVTGSNIPTAEEAGPTVQRKNFDEYHEYLLPLPVVLREGQTAQTEFVRAKDVNATRSFVYDGSGLNINTPIMDNPLLDPQFGTESNTKVVIACEFRNDAAHHLGAPLPQGRLHFYRPDHDGQLQFTGDSGIDNTPPNELVRAVTGNAFDLVGERRQTDFQINEDEHTATESFEIKVRNHRKEAVEIRILEHPSRWRQWEIAAQSQQFKKIDQRTIEFRVPVKSNEEKSVTYSIRYSRLPVARR